MRVDVATFAEEDSFKRTSEVSIESRGDEDEDDDDEHDDKDDDDDDDGWANGFNLHDWCLVDKEVFFDKRKSKTVLREPTFQQPTSTTTTTSHILSFTPTTTTSQQPTFTITTSPRIISCLRE